MDVACGSCLGCRLDRSRMWAARITHEAALHEDNGGNCFVTLTYRNKDQCTSEQLKNKQYIPDNWSLDVPKREGGKQVKQSHYQGFMKRLRKELAREDQIPRKIKYYMAGEYGNICRHGIHLEEVGCPLCNHGRPHYHACIFNYMPNDLELYSTANGIHRWTSPELTRIWGFGHVDVGRVEYQSAAYVARYIMKKITGDNAKEHYTYVDLEGEVHTIEPEYSQMSNGIGKAWYEKHKGDFFPNDKTPILGENKVINGTPRYYAEMLRKEDEEKYEEIKEKRLEYRKENEEEYTPERLYSKYQVKKAQVTNLKRKEAN